MIIFELVESENLEPFIILNLHFRISNLNFWSWLFKGTTTPTHFKPFQKYKISFERVNKSPKLVKSTEKKLYPSFHHSQLNWKSYFYLDLSFEDCLFIHSLWITYMHGLIKRERENFNRIYLKRQGHFAAFSFHFQNLD